MAKNAEVEQWLKSFDHPLKDAILRVRRIVLGAHPGVGECIKWKSPTFTYEGNIASINPNTKKKVSLMFHRGADIPGKHPRLTGGGGTVRYMFFADEKDVAAQRASLEKAIRAWCKMMGGEAAPEAKARRRSARAKPAPGNKTRRPSKRAPKSRAKKRSSARSR